MINPTLSAIIADYFEITGRPVATLTVDEYARFLAMAGESTEALRITSVKQSSSTPLQPKEAEPKQAVTPTINKPKVREQETPKPSKEDMLRILRSVNS